jgi:nicotinamidase/pyrazinamidase
MKQATVQLLIIDPQNDFCDLPEAGRPAGCAPALPVRGADADMGRLAHFIDAAGGAITGMTVTLDSHHRFDIAHPTFWQAGDGAPVPPFTPITAAQVRSGAFRPREAAHLPRALAYLDELERRGRYTLMVWPVHCEIGSWGHNVHPAVKAAYNRWEDANLAAVRKVSKGSNPWTEHYSAMQAEVPDATDPDTQLNAALIAQLDQADRIVIAGEASSHCVKATTEHIAEHLPSGRLDKLILLEDCMSPVAGFEAEAAAFLAAMRARGARVTSSTDLLAQMRAGS